MTPHRLSAAEALRALVTPSGRRDPHPLYEAMRAHGNVVTVRPGLVAVLGYDECVAALRNPDLLVQDGRSHDVRHPGWRDRPSLRGFTHSMLYTNPPHHARMRRLVTGAFTAKRMLALEPAVSSLTDALLDRMAELGAEGDPVDFMAEFAFRLPVAVIGELLGVPENDQVWFREVAAEVTVALEGISRLSGLDAADAAWLELHAYFAQLIERRRTDRGDDLLSALVHVHDTDGSRLDLEELVGNLVLLLVAGFDTTTHLLGTAMSILFARPDLAARLPVEPASVTGFVEETLRVAPPVQATSRWTDRAVDLAGTLLPAGTKVLLYFAAANRDPARYTDPDRFDPGRKANRPLSFGGGMHLCIGAVLARIEARLALPRLLRAFPTIAPHGEPVARDRLIVPGLVSLPVRIDPDDVNHWRAVRAA